MTRIRTVTAMSLRHLGRLEIDLAMNSRRHLVLHGPNGSGKSSILSSIADEVQHAIEGREHPTSELDDSDEMEIRMAHMTRPVRLEWRPRGIQAVRVGHSSSDWICAHLGGDRRVAFEQPVEPTLDAGPYAPEDTVADRLPSDFAAHHREGRLAAERADPEAIAEHELWFERTQNALRDLFGRPDLELIFEEHAPLLRFVDGRRMRFEELAAGHRATLALWAEVALRVESTRRRYRAPSFQPSGVVLIDDLESCLDVRTQRELMPVLMQQFPKLQWIVATHSPLVALSVDDATLVELQSRSTTTSATVRRGGIEALLLRMIGHDGHDDVTEERLSAAPPPPPEPEPSSERRTSDDEVTKPRHRGSLRRDTVRQGELEGPTILTGPDELPTQVRDHDQKRRKT